MVNGYVARSLEEALEIRTSREVVPSGFRVTFRVRLSNGAYMRSMMS